jgi:hypothetical protein
VTSSKPRPKDAKLLVLLRVPQLPNEQLHEAFVNMDGTPEAVRTFQRRWQPLFDGEIIPDDSLVLAERDKLRLVWKAAWEIEEHKSSLARDSRTAYERAVDEVVPKELATHFAIEGKRIVLAPHSIWDAINLLFHRDRLEHRLAICANPKCLNPYFVRKRKTQIYCQAGPCVEEAQREQKRQWWARNRGKAQR